MNPDQKNIIYVRPSGGLGNQLFQLSQALLYEKSVNLINSKNENQSYLDEIMKFNLSSDLNFNYLKRNGLIQTKLINLALRCSTDNRVLYTIFRQFLRIIIPFALMPKLNSIVRIRISNDVGKGVDKRVRNQTLIIGYFQSEKVVSELINRKGLEIFELKTRNLIDDYEELAKVENPIVIQVRLGDYLQELNIGIPKKEFYETSLAIIRENLPNSKVWLFSNDINLAEEYLYNVLPQNYRVIDDERLSPADILQIMRLGSGYIISNSTFGWWGAFLKREKVAPVFVPSPWFKELPEPRDLIPKDWNRIDAW